MKTTFFTCDTDACDCRYRDDQHALPVYVQAAYLQQLCAHGKDRAFVGARGANLRQLCIAMTTARVGVSTDAVRQAWLSVMADFKADTRDASVGAAIDAMCAVPWDGMIKSVRSVDVPYSGSARGFRFDRDRSVAMGTRFRVGYIDTPIAYVDSDETRMPTFAPIPEPAQWLAAPRYFSQEQLRGTCRTLLVQTYELIHELTVVRPSFASLLARRYPGNVWLQNEFFCYTLRQMTEPRDVQPRILLCAQGGTLLLPSASFLATLQPHEFARRWLLYVCAAQIAQLFFGDDFCLRDAPLRPRPDDYDAETDISLVLPFHCDAMRCVMPEIHLLIDLLYRGEIASLAAALTLCEIGTEADPASDVMRANGHKLARLIADGSDMSGLLSLFPFGEMTFRKDIDSKSVFVRGEDAFLRYLQTTENRVEFQYAGERGYGVSVTHEIVDSIFVDYMKHANAMIALDTVTNIAEMRPRCETALPCLHCDNAEACYSMCVSSGTRAKLAMLVRFVVQAGHPLSFSLGALLVASSIGIRYSSAMMARFLLFYDTAAQSRYYSCDTSRITTSKMLRQRYVTATTLPPSATDSSGLAGDSLLALALYFANGASLATLVSASACDATVLELRVALFGMLDFNERLAETRFVQKMLAALLTDSAETFVVGDCESGATVRSCARSRLLTTRLARCYRDSLRAGGTAYSGFAQNLVSLATFASEQRGFVQLCDYIGRIDSAEQLHTLYYTLTAQERIPSYAVLAARRFLARVPGWPAMFAWRVRQALVDSHDDTFDDAWNPNVALTTLPFQAFEELRKGVRVQPWLRISVRGGFTGPWTDGEYRLPRAATCTRELFLFPAMSAARFDSGMDQLCATAGHFSEF